MSDTRAAIRELRSLSEKRSSQGLSAEERVRLDELRQRLGLPPEPELGAGAPIGAPQAPQEASIPPVRRPSLAERIDAAVGGKAAVAADDASLASPAAGGPSLRTGLNGSPALIADLPIPRFDAPEPLPVEPPAASWPAEPVADPEASEGAGAFEPVEASAPGETLPPFEAVDALPAVEPAEASGFPEPVAAAEPSAVPDLEGPADLGEGAASGEAVSALDVPEAPESFAASATESFAASATEAHSDEASLAGAEADTPASEAVEETAALAFLDETGSGAAAELPPDSPLPGDPATEGYGAEPLTPAPDPGLLAAPVMAAEEGYGAEPLTPAPDLGLLPPDAGLPEPEAPVLAAEDLGAVPLDVPAPGETGARPLEESGPIELSAADVMLLEEDPRRDVSDLELGGDASEPLPLAEAHDFVQYQRAEEGSIALEPASEEEGLGDPALLQASEAELATQPAPFVAAPAAPSLRIPPPPPTNAPLPRTATVPSMPAPRAAAAIPPASVPAARAPAPPPPALPPTRTAPEPVARPVTSAPPRRATPTPLATPPPAPMLRPTPLPAPGPAFPVLTAAAPVSTDSPPVKSGPFGRPPPSLMPAAPLDTMDDEPLTPAAPQPAVFGGPYLSPTFIEGEHRVVLHTLEGQVRRGTMSDVDLLDPVIRLNPAGALPDAIPAERIKAIFFMQAPGDAPLPQHGQRIRVSFSDGRQIVGFSEDVEVGENGFFLVPADLRTHTARIYVFRAGVHSITRA